MTERVYTNKYNSMVINQWGRQLGQRVAKRLLVHKDRYVAIQKKTGVPWQLIAALHERESGGNFNTYLGNGQPLNVITTIVPKGRGPFLTFEGGAVDALVHEQMHTQTVWQLEHVLYWAERWNGFGYRDNYHINSPFVWSGTNHYSRGKYDSDGHFNHTLVDQQLGVAVILYYLFQAEKPEVQSWWTNLLTKLKKLIGL